MICPSTPFAQCFHENTAIFVGDFPVGTASATIRHSSVSDYGGVGIVIINEGSTAQIDHNRVFGNQVGIYVVGAAELSHNEVLDNSYFGLALQDGSLRSSHDQILGGSGGVAVIAAFADTVATLDHSKISKTSGPAVQEFECCGFSATTIGGP